MEGAGSPDRDPGQRAAIVERVVWMTPVQWWWCGRADHPAGLVLPRMPMGWWACSDAGPAPTYGRNSSLRLYLPHSIVRPNAHVQPPPSRGLVMILF